ncbi:VCBS repeat-containing protein, partial [Corallococcus terminator]
MQFADLNGDGRADVCGRGSSGLACALSNGASFGPTSTWSTAYSDINGWYANASNWQTIQFADLNGDGRADVCGRGSSGLACALSNGASFGPTSTW